jgi:hypothetical protein
MWLRKVPIANIAARGVFAIRRLPDEHAWELGGGGWKTGCHESGGLLEMTMNQPILVVGAGTNGLTMACEFKNPASHRHVGSSVDEAREGRLPAALGRRIANASSRLSASDSTE